MTSLSRFYPFALLLSATCGACAVAALVTPHGRLVVEGLFERMTGYRAAQERGQHLDEQLAASLKVIEQQRQVLEAVIEGRLTLLEGAAHSHEWQVELKRRHPAAPWPGEGLPDEERACQDVIERVRGLLEKYPEKARAVVARLEAELQGHRARGTLRLPPPPPLPRGRPE